ncbi:MAG: DUF4112 domain-containing protein [Acidiferrobacterales bacterium]|nr:DUF4112 domain-containing protein [Acidiferrobacterales bacterium]
MKLRTDFPDAAEKEMQSSPTEQRLQRLAWVLDSVVPLPGGFRLGLDSLVGLIPGIGDFATAIISTYIMSEGVRSNAPKPVLLRMLGNVAVDTAVGTVPFLGDIFDIGYRSNLRNVNLLKDYLREPEETDRSSKWLLLLIAVCILGLLIGSVLLLMMAIRSLFQLF